MQPRQSWIEEQDHLPRPAGNTFTKAPKSSAYFSIAFIILISYWKQYSEQAYTHEHQAKTQLILLDFTF